MPRSKHRKNHKQVLEKRKNQHKALQAALKTFRQHPNTDPTLIFKEQEDMGNANKFEIKAGGKGVVGNPGEVIPAPVPEPQPEPQPEQEEPATAK